MAENTDDIHFNWTSSPDAHPNRFASTAMLFGMHPSPVTHCRVLELGGGDGANLIPMAYGLPDSEFVGIGLNATEIEQGHQHIKNLNLKNITLDYSKDMSAIKQTGSFDYIIVNGIYSWVSPEVRANILKQIDKLLAPNGVAYINYNVKPGWCMQGMLRDMMLYHTRDLKDVNDVIKKSRELIEVLATKLVMQNDAYGLYIKSEWEHIQKWSDNDFYFHFLTRYNYPFYFYEFIHDIAKFNLQFLGEAQFQMMSSNLFSHEAQDELIKISPDYLASEQNMDFLRDRSYRETLLCRKDIKFNTNPDISCLRQLYFAGHVISMEKDIKKINNNESIEFKLPTGSHQRYSEPLLKAMLYYLSQEWPKPIAISTILTSVHKLLGKEFNYGNEKDLRSQTTFSILNYLWTFCNLGLVNTYMHALPIANKVSDNPKATSLSRYEASIRPVVTNQLHEPVHLSAFNRYLIAMLDGDHDVNKMLDEFIVLYESGKIHIHVKEGAHEDKSVIKKLLAEKIQKELIGFANKALLVK